MEALVSIGLAANVLQFAQLAGKLLSEARSIQETGSPRSLPELRKLTNELNNQTGTIYRYLLAQAGSSTLVPEDKNLIDITYECQTAGSSFSNYLDTLIQNSSSGNHLKTVVATIKFHFEQRKIVEFAVKLDRLRSTLTLASILTFQAHTQANQKNILEHLQRLHKSNETQLTTSLDGLQTMTDILQINQSQTCLQDLVRLRDTLPLKKEKEILAWLNFRQISWRFDEVPTAYKATFDWIFEKPDCLHRWADFAAHLRENVTEPYFIQGKAGSGKSTLMKHIISHSNTEAKLKEWAMADGAELIRVNFFFWNSGTTLQKSANGLLRALLFAVLERHTELIPVVFPDIYQYWKEDTLEPNYTELTKAWLLLTQRSASFLKIAIFIDGIDEFEGDHRGIAKFIRSLASTQIKVILSSRPTTTCLRVFKDCPSLKLQDFTAHDMEVFIRGHLASHAVMMQLLQHHPADATRMMRDISWKAEGVFLWVKLVVKELIEGLEDGDSMEDLRNKLKSISSDLRQLYRRMMSKARTEHQSQAAEIFELLRLWDTYVDFGLLPLAVLHFALEPASTYQALEVRKLDSNTSAWYVTQLSARIRSRCCGLLEVYSDHRTDMVNAFIHGHVGYIHRTVAEFLKSEDVLQEVEGSTRSVRDLRLALITGCLSRLKIMDIIDLTNEVEEYLLILQELYRSKFPQSQDTLNMYFDSLDEVLTQHWRDHSPDETRSHWSSHMGPLNYINIVKSTSSDWEDAQNKASKYTFAAYWGFLEYLKSCCPHDVLHDSNLVHYVLGLPVLYHTELLSLRNHKRDTLRFVLRQLVKPDNAELEQMLFDWARKSVAVARRSYLSRHENQILYANIGVACVLTTAYSAPQLLQKGWDGAPLLEDVLEQLRESEDREDQSMGRQLSEMAERYGREHDLPFGN